MIALAQARRAAINRIITVLREQFATELAALNTTMTGGALKVPAPDDTAFYTDHPDITEYQLTNDAVAVHVWTGGPREIVEQTTHGLLEYKVLGYIPVEVVVLYRLNLQEPYTEGGRALNQAQIMQLRGEIYSGAIINTLYKYACERTANAAISDIQIQLDEATPLYIDELPVLGLAGLSFKITQNTSAPLTRPLP